MVFRILHIWNTAGVPSILAKFMDRNFSTQSWVITRKAFDPWGLTVFGETLNMGGSQFVLHALRRIHKYNLVHIHSLDKLVPWVKRLYPKKSVVIHYHGTDVRGRWLTRQKYWKQADLLLVSTSDLLEGAPKQAIWLPNPIDTDLFYARAKVRRVNHAFHTSYGVDDLAQKIAKKYKLQLTIQDRVTNPISYTEMGEVLSRYEYYIDIKCVDSPRSPGKPLVIKDQSKTGLEALASGCKVISWDDKVISSLPEKHYPKTVVSTLWKHYQEILG
jgi:hypothetical protein